MFRGCCCFRQERSQTCPQPCGDDLSWLRIDSMPPTAFETNGPVIFIDDNVGDETDGRRRELGEKPNRNKMSSSPSSFVFLHILAATMLIEFCSDRVLHNRRDSMRRLQIAVTVRDEVLVLSCRCSTLVAFWSSLLGQPRLRAELQKQICSLFLAQVWILWRLFSTFIRLRDSGQGSG